MSTKNNVFLAAAAAALGVTFTVGAKPICEGMLNDVRVTAFGAVEVDQSGRVLVIVSHDDGADTVTRPVADSSGNVRLYTDANAALSLAKRTSLASGTQVKVIKADKVTSVGDPIVALKSKYKKYKAEQVSSGKAVLGLAEKITAAGALGWDDAVGTPENAEYLDLIQRQVSVTEWDAFNSAKVADLAASLTAANINPITVV